MRDVSGAEVLDIWERGQGQHTLDRALAILVVAFPESSQAELEALVDCPRCQEILEFTLRVDDIRVAPTTEAAAESYQMSEGGYDLRFRLPNSLDLAVLAQHAGQLPDVAAARVLLTQHCVQAASHEGRAVAVADLPDTIVAALAARMAECDPQAEVQLQVACPACGHAWQALFDIATFLWSRILAQAGDLLRDIHTLARAYGWRAADILSMSPIRRQYYLDLVR